METKPTEKLIRSKFFNEKGDMIQVTKGWLENSMSK